MKIFKSKLPWVTALVIFGLTIIFIIRYDDQEFNRDQRGIWIIFSTFIWAAFSGFMVFGGDVGTGISNSGRGGYTQNVAIDSYNTSKTPGYNGTQAPLLLIISAVISYISMIIVIILK